MIRHRSWYVMTTRVMTSQDISEHLISNATNIHRNLQSSADKRDSIGNWMSIIGITVTCIHRSRSSTSLGHHNRRQMRCVKRPAENHQNPLTMWFPQYYCTTSQSYKAMAITRHAHGCHVTTGVGRSETLKYQTRYPCTTHAKRWSLRIECVRYSEFIRISLPIYLRALLYHNEVSFH